VGKGRGEGEGEGKGEGKDDSEGEGRVVRTDELLKCRQGFSRHRGVRRRVEGGCSVVFSLCFLYDRMQSTSLTDMADRIPT
jgi:hypothetical protein